MYKTPLQNIRASEGSKGPCSVLGMKVRVMTLVINGGQSASNALYPVVLDLG